MEQNKPIKKKVIILVIILTLIGTGVYLSHLYFKKTPERLEKTIENRVINGLNQIQNVARAIYEEDRDYSKVSCSHPELTSICKELDLWLGKEPIIHSSPEAYCSYTGLYPGEYYCIDSTGFAGRVNTNPSETSYCDGITFVCKKEEVKDETANWKTYRNTKYGYEIKYPNNWDSPIESGDTDALTGNYSGFFKKGTIILNFSINVYDNDKNLSLKEWWEQEFYEKFTVKYEYSYEGVVPVSSGVEAVKYKIQRMGFEDNCYLILRNQRVYTIYFSVLPGAEEIQQMLSTFRFLE